MENFNTAEILTRIRSKRETLFHYCIQHGIVLLPFWHPDQRFVEPEAIDSDAGRYTRSVVLIMALEHPNVLADDWQVVRTGVFNWSSDVTIVGKAGDLGYLPHVKHHKRDGSSWVLIETANPADWQHGYRAWPKLIVPAGVAA